jgi:hypothetical protein
MLPDIKQPFGRTGGRALAEDAAVGHVLFDRIFPESDAGAGSDTDASDVDRFWTAIRELGIIIRPLLLVRFLDHKLGGSLLETRTSVGGRRRTSVVEVLRPPYASHS